MARTFLLSFLLSVEIGDPPRRRGSLSIVDLIRFFKLRIKYLMDMPY